MSRRVQKGGGRVRPGLAEPSRILGGCLRRRWEVCVIIEVEQRRRQVGSGRAGPTQTGRRGREVGDEQVLRGGDRETRGSVRAACYLTNENRTKGVKVQGCGWDPASSGRGLVKRLGRSGRARAEWGPDRGQAWSGQRESRAGSGLERRREAAGAQMRRLLQASAWKPRCCWWSATRTPRAWPSPSWSSPWASAASPSLVRSADLQLGGLWTALWGTSGLRKGTSPPRKRWTRKSSEEGGGRSAGKGVSEKSLEGDSGVTPPGSPRQGST